MGLLAALGAVVAPGLLAGPLGATLSPRMAVALAPWEPPAQLSSDPDLGVSGHDPWGRPWCSSPGSPWWTAAWWSSGPDGQDDRGLGDDVLRADGPQEALPWFFWRKARAVGVTLALLCGWGLVAGRLLARPRGGRLREGLLGALALLPSALALGLLALAVLESGAPSPLLVVPFPLALAASLVATLGVLGVGWGLARRRAEDEAARRRQARAGLLLALFLFLLVPVASWGLLREERARSRNQGLAGDRLKLVGLAQSRFREAHQRYASGPELVAAGLLAERFLGPWRGYQVEVWVGKPPELLWAAQATPWVQGADPRGRWHLATNQAGVLFLKPGAQAIDRDACSMDPGAVALGE